MRKFFFAIAFLFAPFSWAQDHSAQFQQQLDKGEFVQAEGTLMDWETSTSDDVDFLAATGEFYYRKGRREESLLLDESAEGEDEPTVLLDLPLLAQAEEAWKKAAKLYPWRMDIRLDLAQLYQDLGRFEAEYDLLAKTFLYAEKHRKKLKWAQGADLPEKLSILGPETLQDHIAHYLKSQNASEVEKGLRLARLSITFFPRHPYAYNSMAVYFFNRADWQRALKYFLIAESRNPKDSLVLSNIALALDSLGQKKEAGIFYRKVVALNNDPERVDLASKHLEEIATENTKTTTALPRINADEHR